MFANVQVHVRIVNQFKTSVIKGKEAWCMNVYVRTPTHIYMHTYAYLHVYEHPYAHVAPM